MKIATARMMADFNFVSQLKDCMKVCGYNTPTQLARDLGCEPSVVCQWLQGRSIPMGPTAVAIANTLGISVELLLTGKET